MSNIERTPSDPVRLLDHWREAAAGDITAGRIVANLKQAGMPEFLSSTLTGLQDAGADTTEIAVIIDAWSQWERGKLPPQPLLDAMADAGIEGFFERSVATLHEAFGGPSDDSAGQAAADS